LFRAEWYRFFARRFTLIMVAIAVGLTAIVLINASSNSAKIDAAAMAAAQRQADEQTAANEDARQRSLAQCQADFAADPTNAANQWGPDCSYLMKAYPPAEPEWFLPNSFNLADELEDTLAILAVIITLVGFIVGASFIGAEWSTNSMTNLLLWRPNRLTVLGAKLAAALAGVAVIGIGLTCLWTAGFWALAKFDGTIGHTTAGFWKSILLTDVRALALTLGATVLGFSLASLGRRTAMALGVGTAYGLLEIGSFLYFGLFGDELSDRYRLSTYVAAWMTKSYTLNEPPVAIVAAPGGPGPVGYCDQINCYKPVVINLGDAAWVLGTVVGAVLLLAAINMRQRDVT
jgi:hypothetical protein